MEAIKMHLVDEISAHIPHRHIANRESIESTKSTKHYLFGHPKTNSLDNEQTTLKINNQLFNTNNKSKHFEKRKTHYRQRKKQHIILTQIL